MMNNFRVIVIFIAVAVGLAVGSCAKAEKENISDMEKLAFDAWMEKYVLSRGVSAVEQTNGMYVEFIEDGNQFTESSRDTLVWLNLDYTATDIQNNVFATRDSLHALRQQTYSPYTHYTPDYVFVGREAYGMMPGRHWALQNNLKKPDGTTIKLSEGSHVRLYVPSYLAYGSVGYSNDQGYGGQFALDGTKIVIEDLRVSGVVKDPISKEEEEVVDYASQRWGLGATDTIATCFFVDTLGFRPRAELLERFPEKEWDEDFAITADSTARVWYVGRFLDGFIFDTNIELIHDEFYNRRLAEGYEPREGSFEALEYTASRDEDSYIPAFFQAIPDLRRGQWSRIIFPSAYGYGAVGLSKAAQEQQEDLNAYTDYYMQMSMMQGMYGGGYYNNYYGGYMGGAMPGYMNYGTSGYSEQESEQTISTEILPYTPLIFELYIE